MPILSTSFVYRTHVYWSVIHGIKRKPHLSVVWNWYHFVAIAILHQPRPTDSADINTRLQLTDTSSIPPMHGGFLLICLVQYQALIRCNPFWLFCDTDKNDLDLKYNIDLWVYYSHTQICLSHLCATIIWTDRSFNNFKQRFLHAINIHSKLTKRDEFKLTVMNIWSKCVPQTWYHLTTY